jgi:glyoxylase-like metal-dependent hydrolase (beta-lactamase superfamily II)
MTLKLEVITTGQLGNNVSILFNDESMDAIVFDPSFDPQPVLDFIKKTGLNVKYILLTHGHFDHFAGVNFLSTNLPSKPLIGLHRDDLALLRSGGGSKNFHVPVIPPDEIDLFLEDHQTLDFLSSPIEVRLSPGHTPGSVIFVIPDLHCAICGDVIFYHGIGRTDLTGGDYDTLIGSIQNQVFTLPPETRLIPGHGEETTVREEMRFNPFFNPPD